MIYNDIRIALESHLANTVGIPDVAWPNVPFQQDATKPYLIPSMVPTSRRPTVIGDSPWQRYNGLYSILICTPENQGPVAGYKYADLLTDRFDATTRLTSGALTISIDYAEVRTSFTDSPFYCTPVMIGWHTFYKET